MAKSISVHQKKRGRPATGRDPAVTSRLPEPTIAKVDRWAANNGATRSEAIRRLIELGLTAPAKNSMGAATARLARDASKRLAAGAKRQGRSPKTRAKAADMAGEQIDRMDDTQATDEQRASRKRRLLKGPKEFRDMRSDQAKRRK